MNTHTRTKHTLSRQSMFTHKCTHNTHTYGGQCARQPQAKKTAPSQNVLWDSVDNMISLFLLNLLVTQPQGKENAKKKPL